MYSKKRKELMELMKESDEFFKQFGLLDDVAFTGNIVPKKYKELTMISISIVSMCEECISYHIQQSLETGATKEEIIEFIKMSMMSRGSVSYPYVRLAFKVLRELKIL